MVPFWSMGYVLLVLCAPVECGTKGGGILFVSYAHEANHRVMEFEFDMTRDDIHVDSHPISIYVVSSSDESAAPDTAW